ncbi:putative uncharacterized protein [Brevibacillus laterosporus GI-9]|uniref:VirB4 family type IV secretion system protein n=1 Tax=Brevibacillus TaxID=55080 RepID=UPI000240546F|nr:MULTISPECIES: hypothetical protein [Brevibacillus]MCR8964177.1 hypothetical protein [Brevibacillus laterosporus]MCZ0836332.1 hypothetical protein [Brevibacillus halotolerans]CCF16720.1 putative uncharacterized protein [Brevibacillus laterosporus GI-9]
MNWIRFKKNKLLKSTQEATDINVIDSIDPTKKFDKGKGDIWDILSPDGIDVRPQNHGWLTDSLTDRRPFRPIYVTRAGWPRKLGTDWISKFLGLGEVDVTIYNDKILPRHAIQSLQRMMTMLRSNYNQENKRGNIDQLHDIGTKIQDTDALLEDISMGENDLFHCSVQACVYAENMEMLDQLSNFLEDDLGGAGIHLRTAYERIDSGYLSTLPRGKNELTDTTRNLDRRSLTTLFPFASGEMKYKGGVPFAVNQTTGNLVFLNLFAEDNNNYNVFVCGESGTGKTFFIQTLIGRNLLKGCHTVCIDPEGETKKFVKRIGGLYIKLGSDYPAVINPCALSITEIELDEDDEELKFVEDGREILEKDGKEYIRFVPIKEKINEITAFINVLVQGMKSRNSVLDIYEEGYVMEAIRDCFKHAGINSSPMSLYQEQAVERDGEIYHDLVMKPEITLSDIYHQLNKKYGYYYGSNGEHLIKEPKVERLLAAIKTWLRDGTRGFFDGQTYFGEGISTDIDNAKIVSFDLSEFEIGSVLRKASYHVCLNWIWQKFVKSERNSDLFKIVVADEFWQMVDQPETVSFAEVMGRRCRKRNTSFVIASQDAERILENKQAAGVVRNTTMKFLLGQDSSSYELIKKTFNLSDGEMSILVGNPKKGEGLFKIKNESIHIRTDPFEYEKVLFESNFKKKKELERKLREKEAANNIQIHSEELDKLIRHIEEDENSSPIK